MIHKQLYALKYVMIIICLHSYIDSNIPIKYEEFLNRFILLIDVYIYRCLPPDRTWHKINDTKVGLKWGLGEGEFRHEQRFEPYLTMLVIDPLSAMWAWWA